MPKNPISVKCTWFPLLRKANAKEFKANAHMLMLVYGYPKKFRARGILIIYPRAKVPVQQPKEPKREPSPCLLSYLNAAQYLTQCTTRKQASKQASWQ
jgi:hypothetical protein